MSFGDPFSGDVLFIYLDKSIQIETKKSVTFSESERGQLNKIQNVALSLQASVGPVLLERLKTVRLDFLVTGFYLFPFFLNEPKNLNIIIWEEEKWCRIT